MSKISDTERRLFDELHTLRVEANQVFNQRAFRGIKPNVVDKYAETAHFVYELLQNADDANATEVTITLNANQLLFKHNGTKHFDITAEHDERVGDINSITGIGNSSKESTQNKIGKFGVGFKAVFQYTDTPEIYDDIFKFKIEDLIVPTLIEHDYPGRQTGETLFVLPFREPQKAFEEIKSRLESLKNPVLFLRHLKKIIWQIEADKENNTTVEYSKKLLERQTYNDIKLEKYRLQSASREDFMFLFSRDINITLADGNKTVLPIYIGFYYDKQNKSLITNTTQNIYCFFPTKETFDTCFISHAPFLLTENRQNIKRDENINKELLRCLASLATSAVTILRDYGKKTGNLLINENIVDIIPLYKYYYIYDEDGVFNIPMKEAFDAMLKNEPILLSRNDKYLLLQDAYTSTSAVLELLTQEQFYFLRKHSRNHNWNDKRWISKDSDFLKWDLIRRLDKIDDENKVYINIKDYTIENFGNDISAEFMKVQKIDWVSKFYTFLRSDATKYWKIISQTRTTAHVFRHAPIIKTQSGEWVPPFRDTTLPNVFLPIENNPNSNSDYNFINNEYLSDEMARKFFNELELKQPDEFDYICNNVLKKYIGDENHDVEIEDEQLKSDFRLIVSHYQKVKDTQDEDRYIKEIKSNFLFAGTDDALHKPSELYFKNEYLSVYFGDNGLFFDEPFYKDTIHEYKKTLVDDLIIKLGTKTEPEIQKIEYTNQYNLPPRFSHFLESISYYRFEYIVDYELSGLTEAYKNNRITQPVSVYLWNEVILKYKDSVEAEIATHTKHKQYDTINHLESTFIYTLKQIRWLYDKDGNAQAPKDIFLEDLSSAYDTFNGLAELLGIERRTSDLREKYNATDEEQQAYEMGAKLAQEIDEDFTKEDVLEAVRKAKAAKKQEKERQETEAKLQHEKSELTQNSTSQEQETPETTEDKLYKKWEEKKNRHIGKPHTSTATGQELPIDNVSSGIESSNNSAIFFVPPSNNKVTDEKKPEDTERAEKKLKAQDTTAQSQAESAKEMVDILELLKQTPKYTFKWFKVLMELMHAGQDKITESRKVQIDFSRYDMFGHNEVLHLIEPNRPVPAWVCDADKYTITTISDGKPEKLDGLIIRTTDDSMDVSIRLDKKMLVHLQFAKKFRLVAVDSTNIINSLETRFLQLDKEDDFDMNDNLPKNLSFIYGPPGTGKTTALVKQVHDLLEKEPNAKILVLTPTNKAADVVAIKMSSDNVCNGGLARYGATESLYLIENVACVTNRETTDLDNLHNIVVATAARYAYDYVQPDDTAICDYPWDYIFIDEASMIDILTITYILYKGASAKQIIISGDPKQIKPVVQNDMPALNIYDMVGLQGFAKAVFDYTRYPVNGLMMQHRSVPIIGEMVSKFAYDGLVDCDPNRAPMKPLVLDGIPIMNVNFVGFDVAELDDIKGLNTVNNSAFNLYSVIFTYNMVEYTIKQIEKHYPEKDYSIGVVCAYRAQADAIKSMFENRPLDTYYCKVTCGTVHSFQGDECDIMFIVLNPPAQCTSGTHVNNENIINVAMSRARDYLFFIMPNGQQKGFFMKNRLGALLSFFDRKILTCKDIEKVMFGGNDNFIYENTHVTCHMPVNVYCEDNAVYEVRMSEDALDIKINQSLLPH